MPHKYLHMCLITFLDAETKLESIKPKYQRTLLFIE